MKIYELLDKPEKWIKYTYARDKNGVNVQPHSDAAVCWCLEGAVRKCYMNSQEYLKVLHAIKLELPVDTNIAKWNDTVATYQDVIKLTKELDV